MQLLLIEDDDDLRSELQEYLTRHRHQVTACGSVREARHELERILSVGEPIDAVICDINLSDGDGIELYVRFASHRPACLWIMMSGDPDPQRLADARRDQPALPHCSVVEKPISARTLAEMLEARGSGVRPRDEM